MTGFLTPLVKAFVIMGASTPAAYILIIFSATVVGAIFGARLNPDSPDLMKFCAILGLVFSTILVLFEVFPWL